MSRSDLCGCRRIVIKLGTSLLAPPDGGVHLRRFAALAADVSALLEEGRQIVVVSSGAVGLGVRKLAFASRPDSIPEKQAAAAVGQIDLCWRYERAFARYGRRVGQILLTHSGLADRTRFLNARRTVNTLLEHGVVPIINENDSVSTEELRFGDNDQLAALVVNICEADLLVLLTHVDGLMDREPLARGAQRISELRHVDARALSLASASTSPLGTGGMRSKLEAARTAARSGVATVIADGRRRGLLQRILAGHDVGTRVHPAPQRLSSRKHWIAYSLKPRGTLTLDAGAVRALRERGRSLLPIGVLAAEGSFAVGDLVRCVAEDGHEVARGLISYDATEMEVIKGHPTSWIPRLLGYSNGDEVIHRSDLVVL
ncbi:MAG: glutamate 5-kinase [Myxococcota bacterium]